jgi:hypothetical protein
MTDYFCLLSCYAVQSGGSLYFLIVYLFLFCLPLFIFLGVKGGRSARKADDLTAICEPIVYKMWEPRRLTTLLASAACYMDSFSFLPSAS